MSISTLLLILLEATATAVHLNLITAAVVLLIDKLAPFWLVVPLEMPLLHMAVVLLEMPALPTVVAVHLLDKAALLNMRMLPRLDYPRATQLSTLVPAPAPLVVALVLLEAGASRFESTCLEHVGLCETGERKKVVMYGKCCCLQRTETEKNWAECAKGVWSFGALGVVGVGCWGNLSTGK